ncbi:protein of unknown function [Amycolatopsis arida]|uniref:DUF1707 domain-containing protein n=1 Tax=Amycolatopsis arida TaxID=587909 RepID=A0A1I5TPN5_9PSEU|nr:uncharacterized protein DUF1707 [Amycolatopsis arida]SFP85003.1 protein of unknown function [Amycolatopsis arida]
MAGSAPAEAGTPAPPGSPTTESPESPESPESAESAEPDEPDAAGNADPAPTMSTSAEPAPAETAASAEPMDPEVRRQRNLRVSDREREHVIGLLQKAIGRGLLDLDEFTERTDVALAARTRGELNTVLIDLPGLVHADAPAPTPGYSAAPSPVGSGERMVLQGKGSTIARQGRWVVPAELLVRNKYGQTKLDFSEAELTSPVVHLELDVKWGSVSIVVPPSGVVDTNGVGELKWSTLDDKTGTNGRAGTPRFVLTGRVQGGTVTIRNRRGLFGQHGCC